MFKRFPFIHNHGDFVHLDALRDWLRGVVSLESFLKSKDDKAIVKDIHFTDESTTVDYIDTKDDTEKTETLCEYLTSDVVDGINPNQFNKVDKIKFWKNKHGETIIGVREKESKKERSAMVCTNIPVAYDATDNYTTSQKVAHIGVSENGVKIYNDETLQKAKEYKFKNIPIAYDATDDFNSSNKTFHIGFTENGVNIYNDDTLELVKEYDFTSGASTPVDVIDRPLPDCSPFSTITNQFNSETLNFQKTDFSATIVGDVVIGGQIMYTLDETIWIDPKQQIRLMLTPSSMGSSKFANTVYPKVVMTPDNSNVIITMMKFPSFPMTNSTPTYVTIYNPIENRVPINKLHFTF